MTVPFSWDGAKYCGEAATTTLGPKARQTQEPSGQWPVNLKNLSSTTPLSSGAFSATPFLWKGAKNCREAATMTLGP